MPFVTQKSLLTLSIFSPVSLSCRPPALSGPAATTSAPTITTPVRRCWHTRAPVAVVAGCGPNTCDKLDNGAGGQPERSRPDQTTPRRAARQGVVPYRGSGGLLHRGPRTGGGHKALVGAEARREGTGAAWHAGWFARHGTGGWKDGAVHRGTGRPRWQHAGFRPTLKPSLAPTYS